jgi:NAD(P)-dependent dehydrogenase (short-subunit alcohol dehydrogenase family)
MSNVALVTGGSGGIGRAVCDRLLQEGWIVLAVDIVPGAEAENLHCFSGDISDFGIWKDVLTFTRENSLNVNAFIHTAFFLERESFEDLPHSSWTRHLEVNVGSIHLAISTLGIDSFSSQNASIILTSSVHSHIGVPMHSGYAASKGAMNALARQLAVELSGKVRVNSLVLGPINTPVWQDASDQELESARLSTASLRMGQPRDVANLVNFLVSEQASFINGSEIVIDGGFLAKKETR